MYYKKHILLSLILCMLLLLSASLAPVQALGDYSRTLTIDKHLVINRNSTLQLEPKINGFLANTSAFTYQSSNKAVANVSEDGMITAGRKGVARITITSKDDDTVSTTTKVHVGKKVSKVRLNAGKKTIYQGNYYMLKATVSPKSAAYKKVTYVSSDSTVASVSSKGKITAIAPGTATITVTTMDGSNLTKTIQITVLEQEDDQKSRFFPNPFFKNNLQTSEKPNDL